MNSVSALSRSIALLRVALARSGKALPRSRVPPSSTRSDSAANAPAQHTGPSQLALLPQSLSMLTGDRNARERQALRLFIRAVLLDEFRGSIEPTPDLDDLVERAARQLEREEEFVALTREALAELLPSGT